MASTAQWLQHWNQHHIHNETDCINSNTAAGSFFDKCKELLLVTNFWVSFERQQERSNRIAHSSARGSRSYASPCVFGNMQPFIETIIMNEMP